MIIGNFELMIILLLIQFSTGLFIDQKIAKPFSETLKLAGTIDLLIYNKPKNIISLVDWKTNEKIKIA